MIIERLVVSFSAVSLDEWAVNVELLFVVIILMRSAGIFGNSRES